MKAKNNERPYRIFGGISEFTKVERATDASTVSYRNVVQEKVYYIDDLVVIEQYEKIQDSSVSIVLPFMPFYDGTNYIVRFTDKDGTTVYASMTEKNFEELEKHYNNKKTSSFSGCFSITEIPDCAQSSFKKAYKTHNSAEGGAMIEYNLCFEEAKTMDAYFFNQLKLPVLFIATSVFWCILICLAIIHLINDKKYINQYLDAFYNNSGIQNTY